MKVWVMEECDAGITHVFDSREKAIMFLLKMLSERVENDAYHDWEDTYIYLDQLRRDLMHLSDGVLSIEDVCRAFELEVE